MRLSNEYFNRALDKDRELLHIYSKFGPLPSCRYGYVSIDHIQGFLKVKSKLRLLKVLVKHADEVFFSWNKDRFIDDFIDGVMARTYWNRLQQHFIGIVREKIITERDKFLRWSKAAEYNRGAMSSDARRQLRALGFVA